MRRLVDLIDMPGFNPVTQSGGRGEWGLRCISDGTVTTDGQGKPRCVEHGAMNAVNPDRTLWRCLACGRGCYRPPGHAEHRELPGRGHEWIWVDDSPATG